MNTRNNYAISSSGVAEALKRGGGVLHAYGVDLKDSVALITAANEPLQDPEKVGNGLKSIAINFAGMSASAKDGGIKLNKTAMALKNIAGIDVYSNRQTGQIKSMVNILDELQPKWKNLRDDEKAALSEAIAGKHRANVFQALMNNYDQFKKIREEFANGEHFDSAERENEKYTNSFAGKMNKLRETLAITGTTLINTKMSYGLLDFLNSLATGLNKVISVIDDANLQIPALMAGFYGLRGLFKGGRQALFSIDDFLTGNVSKKGSLINRVKDSFLYGARGRNGEKAETEKSSTKYTDERTSAKQSADGISDANTQIIQSEKEVNKEREKSKEKLKQSEKAHKEHTNSLKNATKESKNQGKQLSANSVVFKEQTQRLKDSAKNLGKSVLSGFAGLAGGVASAMLATAAITKTIELGYRAYDYYSNGLAKSKREHMEKAEALKIENKGIQDNITFVKDNAEAINKLYESQYALSKINRKDMSQDQAEEYTRLVDLSSKIAEIMPNAIRYDRQGNPILAMSVSAETLEKRLLLAQRAKQKLIDVQDGRIYDDNINEFYKGEKIGSNAGGLESRINKYRDDIKKLSSLENKAINDVGLLPGELGKRKESNKQSLWGTINNLTKGVNFGNYKKKIEKFQKDMKSVNEKADKAFSEHNDLIAKYDEASAHNSQLAQRKLLENGRFKKLSEESQNAVADIGSMFTWGKIRNQGEGFNVLAELGEKLQPKKLNEFASELRNINDAYAVNKDFDAYSKSIDNLIDRVSKATGISKEKLGSMIKDINRGYTSLDEMQEAMYLKKHGAKFSDLDSDNKAIASRADRLLDRFRSMKQLRDSIAEAGDDDEALRSVLSSASENGNLGVFGKLADSASKSGNSMKEMSAGMLGLLTLQTMLNDGTKESNDILAKFGDALQNNTGKALDLGNGLQFSSKFMKFLKDNGITKIDDILPPVPDESQYQKVQKHYNKKGQKVNKETMASIANANLTEQELVRLDKAAGRVDKNLRDSFLANGAKYFQGAGTTQEAFRNMANSAEGLRFAITHGLSGSMKDFDKDANKMAQNTSNLSKRLNEAVNSLDSESWVNFAKNFGNLSSQIQQIANEKGIADMNRLTNMQNVFNTAKASGFNNAQAKQIVTVGVETFGQENIGKLNGMLASLPEEKRIKLMTELLGNNGDGVARGLKVLDEHFGTDTLNRDIMLNLILNGDPNLLTELTSDNIEQKIVEVEAKLKGGSNTIKKQVEDSGKGSKVEVKAEVKQTTTAPLKSAINAHQTVPTFFQPVQKQQPSVQGSTGVSIKASGIELVKAMSDALKSFKSTNKQVTLTTNLRGATVGMIKSRTNAVNGFPKGSKTITLTSSLRGATVGMIRSRASAALSFPTGSRTISLITEYRTIGSPSGAGKGSTSGFWGAAFKSLPIPNKENIKNTIEEAISDIAGVIPRAFNTQLNPLVGTTVGDGAGMTSGGTSVGGTYISHGGVASPTAVSNPALSSKIVELASAFKARQLKGFEYKGVTQINKLTYSVKEMTTAYEKDIDILKEFEQAMTRVNNSIKILEVRMQRARGAARMGWLNLTADTLREANRRLKAERDQVEKLKHFYMDKAKKEGFRFDSGVAGNRYKMELMYANKLEALEKKKEKAKGKNAEKIDKEIKDLEKARKTVEKAVEYIEKEVSIDTSVSENDNKLGDIQDEKAKLVIEAWRENFEAVSKLMDLEIQKISTSLDILSTKFKFAFGTERLDILDEQISKYRQMKHQLSSNINTLNNLKSSLKSKLSAEGFTFSGDDISNFQQHMGYLKDTSTLYEDIKSLVNDYFDIINSRIPGATKEIEEFYSKVKEANKQKLEDTKAIEDKIMQMIKKQSDERIKLLEKETRKRTDLIKKRKDEYNEARKEVEYLDEYRKKKEEIDKLKRKRDKLIGDSSQKGQNELQKVEKQIEQKLEDLQKLVGRNIDSKVNNIYDDHTKSLEEQVKKEKEMAEERFTDTALLKKAQQAISSGLFENVNGEIQSLQSALIDYINEFEGGLSATGSLIQSELIAKLNVATDTARNFTTTLSELGTLNANYGGYVQSRKFDEIDKKNNSQIAHYAPLIYINGSVDAQSRDMIEREIQKYLAQHDKFIKTNIR